MDSTLTFCQISLGDRCFSLSLTFSFSLLYVSIILNAHRIFVHRVVSHEINQING